MAEDHPTQMPREDTHTLALRPVTVKQILNATRPHAAADFIIDNAPVKRIVLVAAVARMSVADHCNKYELEDGTGRIGAFQWESFKFPTPDDPQCTSGITENTYVRVVGQLTQPASLQQPTITVERIQPVGPDKHEVFHHVLQALVAHVYLERGPPPLRRDWVPRTQDQDQGAPAPTSAPPWEPSPSIMRAYAPSQDSAPAAPAPRSLPEQRARAGTAQASVSDGETVVDDSVVISSDSGSDSEPGPGPAPAPGPGHGVAAGARRYTHMRSLRGPGPGPLGIAGVSDGEGPEEGVLGLGASKDVVSITSDSEDEDADADERSPRRRGGVLEMTGGASPRTDADSSTEYFTASLLGTPEGSPARPAALLGHLHRTPATPRPTPTPNPNPNPTLSTPRGPAPLDPLTHLSSLERAIMLYILNARAHAPDHDQRAVGVDVSAIASNMRYRTDDAEEISRALDQLIEEGFIVMTVDELHFDVPD